jgi:hypothetical protein
MFEMTQEEAEEGGELTCNISLGPIDIAAGYWRCMDPACDYDICDACYKEGLAKQAVDPDQQKP